MADIKILFATSEITPLIKTGGLADVSAALPVALRALGVDVRVLVPGYIQVMAHLEKYRVIATIDALPGFPTARLLSWEMSNALPLLVLDCPSLFQREGGPYQNSAGKDWVDNAHRFGMLSKVAALLASNASPIAWHPDIVHCNDWQTGLAPAYLHFAEDAAASVITIHNMAFQGNFAATMVQELHLPTSCFDINGVEFHGNMSFLKAGLFYADHITTVSPNYALEIQQEALGFGMQGLLSTRSNDLTGILNGIDIEEWNPETDQHLSKRYSSKKMIGKSANKEALQSKFGLKLDPDIPLLGVVSRFTEQKGLDLLLETVPLLTEIPVQLAMLGSGDAQLQRTAHDLSHHYPGKVGMHIGFSEELSHQIEAGADIFVMPSRFEPCGLNQFYSQRYGTPPIVHATGGLADSVIDCTNETLGDGTASGFMFDGMTAENLVFTIQRAVELYRSPRKWKALRKNCMAKDFSWKASAEIYLEVYKKVLEGK